MNKNNKITNKNQKKKKKGNETQVNGWLCLSASIVSERAYTSA
jgi:hypothetical protein